ncbi:MAG: peptide/nickel transport system permease protein [Planctomycetota bacterium]|jgi:peptide/nickel transport system permease protein
MPWWTRAFAMPESPYSNASIRGGASVHGASAGRDLWDDVFGELSGRWLVRLALIFLMLVHGLAIFAPLLASDRPYLLEAVDQKAYDSARRGLVGVTSSLRDLAREGSEGYAESRADLPEAPPFAEAVKLELGALGLRLETMRTYLRVEDQPLLLRFEERSTALVEEVLRERNPEASGAKAERLREEALELRRSFEILGQGRDPDVGVELVGNRSYPLFKSLNALEVFFMVLWLLVACWPLWNRFVNAVILGGSEKLRRRARRIKCGAVALLALVAALLWLSLVGGGSTFDVSGHKPGLTDGKIIATRVVFPPLAIGFAETHVEEPYRPPTWLQASEIDDRGYYVHGARVPEPDLVTGEMPAATPVQVRFGEPGRNAGTRHIFGTDETGRDLFVRMLFGARISLAVGVLSTLILAFLGVLIGTLAGFAGGRTDMLLSRFIEVVQSVPAFFLILAASAIVPAKTLHPIFAIVIFIGVVRWTGIARLVRAEFLRLREQEFVLAARATGFSPLRVALGHVLPNAMGPVLVAIAFAAASGILTESAISFLGFGVQEPIPSWGSLLSESRAAEHWWIQVFPGLAIFATVLSYNLVGEGVRDALDPRTSLARRGH